MGIFTRFRDIVSANLNSILDRAEDPEKMVRLMIQEMEDTLIEVKANCAGVMAGQKKIEREMNQARRLAAEWEDKAELAVRKGREELARGALNEKRRHAQRVEGLQSELERLEQVVKDYQSDIAQLEAKLADAREKQRSIMQRRTAAQTRYEAQTRIRRIDTTDAFAKFEAYENSIERLEAETGLVDGLRPKKPTLSDELDNLEYEEEIEEELNKLREQVKKG